MQYIGQALRSVGQYYNEINPATLTGAIDIVVVERENEKGEKELSCSPFHVRFGKFNVFRPTDRKVKVTINGEDVPFSMKIGETGEAFFVFETDEKLPEHLQTSPLQSPTSDDSPHLEQPEPLQLDSAGYDAGHPPESSVHNQDEKSRPGRHDKSHSEDLVVDVEGYKVDANEPISLRPEAKSRVVEGLRKLPTLAKKDPLQRGLIQVLFESSEPQVIELYFEDDAARKESILQELKHYNEEHKGAVSVDETGKESAQEAKSPEDHPHYNVELHQFELQSSDGSPVNFELSFCGKNDDAQNIASEFEARKVSLDQFVSLEDIALQPNVTLKYADHFYSWDNAPAVFAALTLFRQSVVDFPQHHGIESLVRGRPGEPAPKMRGSALGAFDMKLADIASNLSKSAKQYWAESSEENDHPVSDGNAEQLQSGTDDQPSSAAAEARPEESHLSRMLNENRDGNPNPASEDPASASGGNTPTEGNANARSTPTADTSGRSGMNDPLYDDGSWHEYSGTQALSFSPSSVSPSLYAVPDAPKPAKSSLEDHSFVKTLRLTSDQLKQLPLRRGQNVVTFTVQSNYSGYASCAANIFLWDSDAQIVVSDIDGTITKSDALGHVFAMIGRDWTHSGVAELYQQIAENGYQVLYLTARAIGQAEATREYLRGIKQNGHGLPPGPVIMSPDRLITSLHREVIMRKPDAFKIACLRDIEHLFGPSKTPFYAGFGNRITDAISYRAVSVPSSRIYTIDPNSNVTMELLSLAGFRSSYVLMGELVDQLFPPLKRNTQEAEYSDVSYWRPALASIEIPDLPDLTQVAEQALAESSFNASSPSAASPAKSVTSANADGDASSTKSRRGLTRRLGSIASSLSLRSPRTSASPGGPTTPEASDSFLGSSYISDPSYMDRDEMSLSQDTSKKLFVTDDAPVTESPKQKPSEEDDDDLGALDFSSVPY